MERTDGGAASPRGPVQQLVGQGDAVTALAAGTVNGRDIAVTGTSDGTLTIWELSGGGDPIARHRRAHDGGVHSVALTRLGGRGVVVSGGGDGIVRVWEAPSGSALPGGDDALRDVTATLRAHTGTVRTVTGIERGNGSVIVASGDSGILDLWHLGPGPAPAENVGQALGIGHGPVLAMDRAVLSDRLVILTGRADGTVSLQELSGVSAPLVDIRRRSERVADDEVGAVAVVPLGDSLAVATGSRTGIRLWAMSTLRPAGDAVEVHGGPVNALAACTANGGAVLASGGEDGLVRLWALPEGAPLGVPLGGHTGAVTAIALAKLGGRWTVVSGGADGTVRAWRLEDLRSAPVRDQVEWVPDAPADRDLLHRAPLAHVLATRMRRLHQDEPDATFLIHVDGPWGSGKSTLLNLLEQDLGEDWLVVRFDAWRQSRIGPPWWAVLMALRRAIRNRLGAPRRSWLRVVEGFTRARRTGSPYLLAFGLLAMVMGGFYVWLGDRLGEWLARVDVAALGGLVQGAPALLLALAGLWAGTRVLGRFLLWDSASGARLFMESGINPMREVAEHFKWLLRRAGRPVVIFVDDLDRCPPTYVVELLDCLQTTLHGDGESGSDPAGVHFVVAADGAWIRQSYEIAYDRLAWQVVEPGRPLGHLFVDKLFQLTVPVPAIGTQAKQDYLRELLHTDVRAGRGDAELQRVRSAVAQSRSEAEVVKALQGASQQTRELVADLAVEQLSLPAVQAGTEHALQRFAPLLSANPRNIKRFVNEYGILRAVRTLEGNPVDSGALALWTIVQIRWPSVAAHLVVEPEAIDEVGKPYEELSGIPDQLRPVFTSTAFAEVVHFEPGGPLTPSLIRRCSGDPALDG